MNWNRDEDGQLRTNLVNSDGRRSGASVYEQKRLTRNGTEGTGIYGWLCWREVSVHRTIVTANSTATSEEDAQAAAERQLKFEM